jgi:hypothetical protein
MLWPVHLLPLHDGADVQDYWAHIANGEPGNPLCEVEDEFTGDPADFQSATAYCHAPMGSVWRLPSKTRSPWRAISALLSWAS